MNRINKLFKEKQGDILSVYFTAGYPQLDDTFAIVQALEKAGVDMVEIGIPFSDPVADGPTIQESSTVALENGMTLKLLFEQLQTLRDKVTIPVVLMGYINPVLQYGIQAFCKACQAVGVDGLILPDLPVSVFEKEYKQVMESHGLKNIFLITPQTPEERIIAIDNNTDSFIYMVSSASTTGAKDDFDETTVAYFKRIADMKLKNPTLIGFGISNHTTFTHAATYSRGAIIGSAFIRQLQDLKGDMPDTIHKFVQNIKA